MDLFGLSGWKLAMNDKSVVENNIVSLYVYILPFGGQNKKYKQEIYFKEKKKKTVLV